MISRARVWLNRTYAENVFFMDQLRRNLVTDFFKDNIV